MSKYHDPNPERKLPNRSDAAIFLAKSSLLKLRRLYIDAVRTPVKVFDRLGKGAELRLAVSQRGLGLMLCGAIPEDLQKAATRHRHHEA